MSFFFFQAEDGIRDDLVTGVQTCALPISALEAWLEPVRPQRVRERPDGLPAQPAVRRTGVHAAHAALRCFAAEPDRDPESRAYGRGQPDPAAVEYSARRRDPG